MNVRFALAALAAWSAAAQAQDDYSIRPAPIGAVRFSPEGFWGPRVETDREVTIGHCLKECEETGRIDGFAIAAGLMEGEYQGAAFNDSDVYKTIEAAAYSLMAQPDAKLDTYLDGVIAKIAAAQEPDGYLYAARTAANRQSGKVDARRQDMMGPERWSRLGGSHELYAVGHLYEAAVAHYQATGKRTLLEVAIKNADLLCKTFGPDALTEPPGHPEIELALAKLYRATGERRYLDLAKFYLDLRGREATHKLRGPGQQDHLPLVEQSEAVGHAVRGAYLFSGMADAAMLGGAGEYVAPLDRLWESVVSAKLYLTGGIGASKAGEAFGRPYELPNAAAYCETCAAIANALWNWRMFQLHGDGKYLDVFERVAYNGFLSGVSLSGDLFFYPNPLQSDGKSGQSKKRAPWFGCACCPPNVARFLASLGGYVYAVKDDALIVNLYAAGTGELTIGDRAVRVAQETRYPWDGAVRLTLEPDALSRFAVWLRIPGWATGAPVPSDLYRYANEESPPVAAKVNGKAVAMKIDNGFLKIAREWKKGDTIQLEFPMPIRRVWANENVKADAGRVALERGPIVYCVEGADHGGHVLNLALPDDAKLKSEFRSDLLGGVTVLKGKALSAVRKANGSVRGEEADLTAIPYYAWCNRGPNEMAVWLPRRVEDAQAPPAPTLASQSRATASHCIPKDSEDAVNDQIEPKNSNDQDIPRFTWWDHRGTTEWIQYEFKAPAKVSAVEVYWFDDTGRGQCRVPQSWRLLYRDGESWKPVANASEYGVRKDRFNRTQFDPMTTGALRIEVQLQPKVSGGVLEWKVE
ncbi:MAG: glycoside hydrolase family 127 protein [Candidatus Sumerlaeota bacterium]|nr:glycoside hydrolase family 127 protein [Candidatus Sumerlaeota bacterium]